MIARARKVLAAVATAVVATGPNGWHAGQVLSVESEPTVYLELARERERECNQSVRLDVGRGKRGDRKGVRRLARNVSHYREGTSRCYCRHKETSLRMRRVLPVRIRSFVRELKNKRGISLSRGRRRPRIRVIRPAGGRVDATCLSSELPFMES